MNYSSCQAQGHCYEYSTWATTAQGTEIACYSSYPLESERNANPILLIGGVHGDEPEGVRLAEETLHWLKSDSAVNTAPWILIPCINPDGIARNERTNSRGVDLNRNYPSRSWNSDAEKPRYFPGNEPGSEIETQAMVKIIEKTAPRLIIHCHSWEPCVVYSSESGRAAAEALGKASGYEVQDSIGYDCPGSLGDYGKDIKTPVVCIEAQAGAALDSIWPRFEPGIKNIFLNQV